MAVVASPIFEEAVFRGFLQPLLSRTFGTIAGILITAALFGGLHWPEYSGVWQDALAITLLGAIFGWVRVRTNSLIPSTIMHACFNSLAVLGLVLNKYPHLK
jgi:membrane protease YdiL (CAAX protease family)